MPKNGRWDLIRRLKVKYNSAYSLQGYNYMSTQLTYVLLHFPQLSIGLKSTCSHKSGNCFTNFHLGTFQLHHNFVICELESLQFCLSRPLLLRLLRVYLAGAIIIVDIFWTIFKLCAPFCVTPLFPFAVTM